MAIVSQPIRPTQNPQTEIPAEGVGNPIMPKKPKKKKKLIIRLLRSLAGQQTKIMNRMIREKDSPEQRRLGKRLRILNHKQRVIQKLGEGKTYFEEYCRFFNDVETL